MPRRSPKLILAAERAAEARRIVARQEQLIAGLKAAGRPTEEAELYLKAYIKRLDLSQPSSASSMTNAEPKGAKPEKNKSPLGVAGSVRV
jgi:hypothetical protein